MEVEQEIGGKNHGQSRSLEQKQELSIQRQQKDTGAYMYAKKFRKKYCVRRMGLGESHIWIYDGKSYEPLSDDELEYLIYELLNEGDKMSNKSVKGLVKEIKYNVDFKTRGSAIFEIGRKHVFAGEDFKSIYGKVVCDNGIYNVRTREFSTKFSPEYPFYFRVHANYLNDISDEEIKTPCFDKILSDACNNDAESVKTIMDAFGTCLIPDRAKQILVLGTASNSGKSLLFGHFLDSLLSSKRVSHVSLSDISKPFSLGNIEEKVLLSCLDCDMGVVPSGAVGLVKRITGEDMISVRQIYKSQKDIMVRFKLIFGTNGSFAPAQPDAGWTNRIIALPFICEKLAEEIDLNMPLKLEAEKDMIVTKVLRNLSECVDGENIKIRESVLSKKCKEMWCSPTDYLDEFMAEQIHITGEKDHNYKADELYKAYIDFFHQRKMQKKENKLCAALPQKQLIKKLEERSNGCIHKYRVKVTDRPGEYATYPNAVYRICGLLLLNGNDNSDISDIARE